jgi:hypothetical protein
MRSRDVGTDRGSGVQQLVTKAPQPKPRQNKPHEDTAVHSLSKADRKKLAMDAWEPSLLRKLLTAQNRLKQGN